MSAPLTPRCAAQSLDRGDPREGTATPVSRWLLVEQPGPWGRDALLSSRLDRAVAAELDRRCREAGVRPMLIRRPGRAAGAPLSSDGRRWAYVDSRPGHEEIRWGFAPHEEDLADVPLDGSGPTPAVGAERTAYLVCAHGRHDACCAIRGRPVAAALAALRPEQTWECSHTGGDRFAANVVILPHGLYYGAVTAADAERLVAAEESGQVVPGLLRGRSALPMPVQAAQHHARAAVADLGVDGLAPITVARPAEDVWRVAFAHPAGPVTVTLRVGRSDGLPRLTCGAAGLQRMPVYDLVDVTTG